MVAGLRAAREIGTRTRLRAMARRGGPAGRRRAGRRRLRAYVRESLRSYFHYAGRAGWASTTMAVVDTDLRVHGIDGLRVADAP